MGGEIAGGEDGVPCIGIVDHTYRAYERKSKDLNKAQFDIVMRLAKTLKCEAADLLA